MNSWFPWFPVSGGSHRASWFLIHTGHYVNSYWTIRHRELEGKQGEVSPFIAVIVLFFPVDLLIVSATDGRAERSAHLPLPAPRSPTSNYVTVKFPSRHRCSLSGAAAVVLPATSVRTEAWFTGEWAPVHAHLTQSHVSRQVEVALWSEGLISGSTHCTAQSSSYTRDSPQKCTM